MTIVPKLYVNPNLMQPGSQNFPLNALCDSQFLLLRERIFYIVQLGKGWVLDRKSQSKNSTGLIVNRHRLRG